MLELRGVSKGYGKVAAVQPLDLTLETGRTTALIGPSGCGKSTLLRLLMGLIAPDTGRVLVDGVELTPANARQLRLKLGYVIQDGGLFPHLSAAANVSLMARYLGRDARTIGDRVASLARLTKLSPELVAKYPSQLSGGQKQRVSLMRALMLDPACLLLDEPLGALDPMIRSELQSDLRDICRRLGKTTVLVTHDLAEAAYLGDTIILMKDGRVVQKGTFDDLVERPADPFVTAFVNAQRTLPVKERT